MWKALARGHRGLPAPALRSRLHPWPAPALPRPGKYRSAGSVLSTPSPGSRGSRRPGSGFCRRLEKQSGLISQNLAKMIHTNRHSLHGASLEPGPSGTSIHRARQPRSGPLPATPTGLRPRPAAAAGGPRPRALSNHVPDHCHVVARESTAHLQTTALPSVHSGPARSQKLHLHSDHWLGRPSPYQAVGFRRVRATSRVAQSL